MVARDEYNGVDCPGDRDVEETASTFQIPCTDSPVGEVERHRLLYEPRQNYGGELAALSAVVGSEDQAARCASAG